MLVGSRVPLRAGNRKASDIIVGTATGNARRMGERMDDPVVGVNILFFMMRIISAKFVNMMLVIWNREFHPCKHDVFLLCFHWTYAITHPSISHLTISGFWYLPLSQPFCFLFSAVVLHFFLHPFDYRNPKGRNLYTAPSFIKSHLKHHGPWSLHDLNASS